MPRPALCQEVVKRLRRHGLPQARIEEIAEELAEHWEDLREAACQRGLTAAAAITEADQRLGTSERLANEAIAALRHRCWLGRHPILSVCLLPLLLPLLFMAAVLGPAAWVEDSTRFLRTLDPAVITLGAQTVHYGAVILSLGWLNWRAWQRGLGGRWIIALSLWCALTALVRRFDADPYAHQMMLGLTFPLSLNVRTAVLLFIHSVPIILLFFRPARKRLVESTAHIS